jgi:hypothetical protein
VAFFRLDELLHAMRKDAEVPPTRLKGKKGSAPNVLTGPSIGRLGRIEGRRMKSRQ